MRNMCFEIQRQNLRALFMTLRLHDLDTYQYVMHWFHQLKQALVLKMQYTCNLAYFLKQEEGSIIPCEKLPIIIMSRLGGTYIEVWHLELLISRKNINSTQVPTYFTQYIPNVVKKQHFKTSTTIKKRGQLLLKLLDAIIC